MKTCTYYLHDHFCGERAVGRYLPGWRCPVHTPAAILGRPEPDTADAPHPAQLRDEGAHQVLDASDDSDKSVVRRAILEVARQGAPFSPNDVRPLLPKLRSNNLIGAMFLSLLHAGEISKVDETPSDDDGTHYKKVGVYVLAGAEVAA